MLVFLDSHIEVNVDWLPPLLARLSEGVDGRHVRYSPRAVMPVIDVINADTFEYNASPLVRGGFNWGLHFKWDNLPKGTLKRKSLVEALIFFILIFYLTIRVELLNCLF